MTQYTIQYEMRAYISPPVSYTALTSREIYERIIIYAIKRLDVKGFTVSSKGNEFTFNVGVCSIIVREGSSGVEVAVRSKLREDAINLFNDVMSKVVLPALKEDAHR